MYLMIDNQKKKKTSFHNQLELYLPATVVFVRVCKGVLGVDERNNIPT
jgi:hypothetical protein